MLKYQALTNKFNKNLTIGQYNSLDEFKFLKLKGAIVNLQILTDIYKNYYDDYKNEESSDLMINLFGFHHIRSKLELMLHKWVKLRLKQTSTTLNVCY